MGKDPKAHIKALMEESKATALKRGAAWTEEEDDLLRSSSSNQEDLLAAAQLVHRTLGAVIVRYYKVRSADRAGTLLRYAERNTNNYPDERKTRIRIFTAPACACADPWDHRDWCPDLTPTSTEGESNVTVLDQAYTPGDQACDQAA